MSQSYESSNGPYEAWQELQETLYEAYEMQQEAAVLNGETTGASAAARAIAIRLTLAPAARGEQEAVFGSPQAILGAAGARVQTAPLSGKAYVPIRTRDAQTGQTTVKGLVYIPQRGSNVVRAAAWAPPGLIAAKQVARWLRRQIQRVPALRERIQSIQVLIDGQPCRHCADRMAAAVQPVVPAQADMRVRFAPTLPATAGPANTPPPAAPSKSASAASPTAPPRDPKTGHFTGAASTSGPKAASSSVLEQAMREVGI